VKDPAQALAAKQAIIERFGGVAHCDAVVVR
jgi:hypothetical protein